MLDEGAESAFDVAVRRALCVNVERESADIRKSTTGEEVLFQSGKSDILVRKEAGPTVFPLTLHHGHLA